MFSNRGEKKRRKKKAKLASFGKITSRMYYFWLFLL